MKLFNLFAKAVRVLTVIVGVLLFVGPAAHTALTSVEVSDMYNRPLWSVPAELLPVSGGALLVPEIDPSSAGKAIAMTIGGLLLVVSLRRRRGAETAKTSAGIG